MASQCVFSGVNTFIHIHFQYIKPEVTASLSYFTPYPFSRQMYVSLSQYGNIWVYLSQYELQLYAFSVKITKQSWELPNGGRDSTLRYRMLKSNKTEPCNDMVSHPHALPIHKSSFFMYKQCMWVVDATSTQCLPNTSNGATCQNQPVFVFG